MRTVERADRKALGRNAKGNAVRRVSEPQQAMDRRARLMLSMYVRSERGLCGDVERRPCPRFQEFLSSSLSSGAWNPYKPAPSVPNTTAAVNRGIDIGFFVGREQNKCEIVWKAFIASFRTEEEGKVSSGPIG